MDGDHRPGPMVEHFELVNISTLDEALESRDKEEEEKADKIGGIRNGCRLSP